VGLAELAVLPSFTPLFRPDFVDTTLSARMARRVLGT
jgi:hypothetical protein